MSPTYEIPSKEPNPHNHTHHSPLHHSPLHHSPLHHSPLHHSPLHHSTTHHSLLPIHPDPEAKQLRAIGGGLYDGEAEVQRDRHRAKHWDRDSQAKAGGDAVVMNAGVAFDGAGIDEADEV